MNKRVGDWIETFNGISFYSFDPHEDEVSIEDISHALSYICRFNGHSKHFYSVAQHSLNVQRQLLYLGASTEVQLLGLLHDASEAYLCDIPRPLKPFINGYHEAESKLMDVILRKYQIVHVDWSLVKIVDDQMLAYEANRLMSCVNWKPKDVAMCQEVSMTDIDPLIVQQSFLDAFYNLQFRINNIF